MGSLPRLAGAVLLVIALPSSTVLAQEAASGPSVTGHAVSVALDPETGRLDASDTMTVHRGKGGGLSLILRDGFEVSRLSVDGVPVEAPVRVSEPAGPGLATWIVPIAAGAKDARVEAAWGGTVREDVHRADDLAFVAGDRSRGTISPEGVFLTDATGWLPLDGSMATFRIAASVPEGWTVATQGGVPTTSTEDGRSIFTFEAGLPSDGLWLQAGSWKVERRTLEDGISLGTYLSEKNAPLSGLLMDAVQEYLVAYRRVLGPYPHAKFDVVENFFSTGYGMPSATLLGGDVIAHIGVMAQRMGGKVPAGYLDHELVHCWWGNGVFVDYSTGNWCEALTTYFSNYLRKEWESQDEAAKHRRGVRARFAARVTKEKDYPLRRFTGKTEDFENDIGYGKGSMLFHAVRREIGDDAFFGALREFAAAFAGRRASWEDLRAAFEKTGKRRLEVLFSTMLDRTGAPLVRLEGWTAEPDADGWTVRGAVVQDGTPWTLTLPVVVETARGSEERLVSVRGERVDVSIHVTDLPLRVLLDPAAHAWRGYAAGEVPVTLDATLHTPAGSLCLTPWRGPDGAEEPERNAASRAVAEAVRSRPGFDVLEAPSPEDSHRPVPPMAAPGGRSLLLLGPPGTNFLLDAFLPHLMERGLFRVIEGGFTVHGQTFRGDDLAVLLSFRHPENPAHNVTIFTGSNDAALAAARRLFFYGGDGTVVFKAGRPMLRVEADGDASSRVSLLPELFRDSVSAERVGALVADLATFDGRRAGTERGEAAVDRLADVLRREDGLEVISQDVAFEIVDWAGPESATCASPLDSDCTPFFFSPSVAEWQPLPAEAPFRVDATTTPEKFLSDLQRLLESRPGPVLVVGPAEIPEALRDYLVHPSALPPSERARLDQRRAAGGDGDPVTMVIGKRARLLLPDFPITVPVVYFATEPTRSALPSRIRSPLTTVPVRTRNLFAVLKGTDATLAGEAILLSAHHDHLGTGFSGADDNASGVAAVREAARALVARKDLLGRSVVFAYFGAEEWGLRGATAFATSPPAGFPRIVAAFNLDTVGARGEVHPAVVGRTVYPGLASVADRTLAAAGFTTGRDIDRFAFAWGSDHYALHRAGIPCVNLFAGDYRSMHTSADTVESVDAEKVSRIARAAAAWVLALSRGEVPR
jgi:hypothetical protein